MSERSARQRFGQGRHWTLNGDVELNVGDVIASAGPGEGFAMVPWALDTYERVLRLGPGETWLLKRMLKHAWEADTKVYLSIRKITRQAIIGRNRIRDMLARLEDLGYITRLPPEEGDPRRHYSVKGLYDALALCIVSDPQSKWAKAHGVLTREQVGRLVGSHGQMFSLDFDALPSSNGYAAGLEAELARAIVGNEV